MQGWGEWVSSPSIKSRIINEQNNTMSHSTTIKTVPISSRGALRAAVAELQQSHGINIELVENEKPRMYYSDQIAKQIVGKEGADEFEFNSDPDVCDFVIKVPGSYYDIGLLRNAGGGYTPVFDDYSGGSVSGAPTTTAMRGLKDILGNKYDGKVEHWAGRRDDVAGSLFSIGKLLAGYTKHATIEAATMAGHTVQGCVEDPDTGEIKLTLGVA